jgi:type II secretory pathway pseudopilin PulG
MDIFTAIGIIVVTLVVGIALLIGVPILMVFIGIGKLTKDACKGASYLNFSEKYFINNKEVSKEEYHKGSK